LNLVVFLKYIFRLHYSIASISEGGVNQKNLKLVHDFFSDTDGLKRMIKMVMMLMMIMPVKTTR